MKASGISAAPPFGRRRGAEVWLLPCFPDMKPLRRFITTSSPLFSSVYMRLSFLPHFPASLLSSRYVPDFI